MKNLKFDLKSKSVNTLTREISIQGEGDGTGCAFFNQLWAWLILNHEKYFSVKQQPILQLIDNCICGTIPFPLYRDFPALTQHI